LLHPNVADVPDVAVRAFLMLLAFSCCGWRFPIVAGVFLLLVAG
jgi:hypothetical protein